MLVLIDAGELFILRNAAREYLYDHADSPNAPSVRRAIEASIEAQKMCEFRFTTPPQGEPAP